MARHVLTQSYVALDLGKNMNDALHAISSGVWTKKYGASSLMFPSFSLCRNTAASETFMSPIYSFVRVPYVH